MLNRRIIALLTLLLTIMPIAAAYAHYADMAPRFPVPHGMAASGAADGSPAATLDCHRQPGKAHPSACHAHPCLDCAVTVTFAFALAQGGVFYHAALNSDSLSVVSSPAIKPPISRLYAF